MKIETIIEVLETIQKKNEKSQSKDPFTQGMIAGSANVLNTTLRMLYELDKDEIGQEEAMSQGMPY